MKCFRPIRIFSHDINDYITVPCGKCPACRLNRSRDWQNRLQIEQRNVHYMCNNYFFTLTYDTPHLKYCHIKDDYAGVDLPRVPVVNKRDCQLFLDRLRKNIVRSGKMSDPSMKPFTYFLVSEYCPTSMRPHYHVILMHVPILDFWDMYKLVLESWNNGFVLGSAMSPEHCGYSTKYCLCDMDLPWFYPKHARPFILASKGIGKCFATDAMKLYYVKNNRKILEMNGFTYRLPRYLKEKLFPEEILGIEAAEFFLDACDENELMNDRRNRVIDPDVAYAMELKRQADEKKCAKALKKYKQRKINKDKDVPDSY